ncbi:hypothetical protein D3C72_1635660 [compost metagenome]
MEEEQGVGIDPEKAQAQDLHELGPVNPHETFFRNQQDDYQHHAGQDKAQAAEQKWIDTAGQGAAGDKGAAPDHRNQREFQVGAIVRRHGRTWLTR